MDARGVNREGAAPKLARALEIFAAHHPVNYGNVAGNSLTKPLAELVALTRDNTVSHAVFRSVEDVTAVLADLRKEDLGISIVVSGLFEEVRRACCDNHLKPHTVNLSLGVFGKTEKLPAEPILEIASMCGHNMISFGLIQKLVTDIEEGCLRRRKSRRAAAAAYSTGNGPHSSWPVLLTIRRNPYDYSSPKTP